MPNSGASDRLAATMVKRELVHGYGRPPRESRAIHEVSQMVKIKSIDYLKVAGWHCCPALRFPLACTWASDYAVPGATKNMNYEKGVKISLTNYEQRRKLQISCERWCSVTGDRPWSPVLPTKSRKGHGRRLFARPAPGI